MALYSRLTHRYLDADRTYGPSYLADVVAEVADLKAGAANATAGAADVTDASVLELGCGADPVAARALAGRCATVSVDRHPTRLAAARAAVPTGEFIEADFRDLAFPAGRFTAAVSFYALIHLPVADLPPLLRRIATWLRPGGLFVGSIGAACSAFPDGPPADLTCVPTGELRSMLCAAGFVIEREDVDGWSDGDGHAEFTFFRARTATRTRTATQTRTAPR